MTRIRIMRAYEKQEPSRVQRMEGLRKVEQLNNMLLGKIKVHSVSKKAHLRVTVNPLENIELYYHRKGVVLQKTTSIIDGNKNIYHKLVKVV